MSGARTGDAEDADDRVSPGATAASEWRKAASAGPAVPPFAGAAPAEASGVDAGGSTRGIPLARGDDARTDACVVVGVVGTRPAAPVRAPPEDVDGLGPAVVGTAASGTVVDPSVTFTDPGPQSAVPPKLNVATLDPSALMTSSGPPVNS